MSVHLKPGCHIIITIAILHHKTVAILTICDFHMIVLIATVFNDKWIKHNILVPNLKSGENENQNGGWCGDVLAARKCFSSSSYFMMTHLRKKMEETSFWGSNYISSTPAIWNIPHIGTRAEDVQQRIFSDIVDLLLLGLGLLRIKFSLPCWKDIYHTKLYST